MWQKDGAILRSGRAWSFDRGRNQDGDLLGAPGLRGRKGACAERRSEDHRPRRKRRSLCIVETTQVKLQPYDEVEARFAFEEGEGDRSLEYRRDAH